MPQESLRSRIYRSFVTCNDPKGIVDCSTIRKQKVCSSEMEKRIKSQTRRNSYDSLDGDFQRERTAIRGLEDEFDSSSSFQLMEVSRGAQKLKQTIDLWSNEVKYDRQSEKIARDLFEGALELQESLAILGKLQKASWYMTQDKKNEQKERTGNMDMERTYLQRGESRKPRLSVDYSYGNGAEELKKMIRDRLAKQILQPTTANSAGKACFPESNSENSGSEMASTSSSRSSMVYTTAASPEKKRGGKNMIAKLMGLELHSKEMQETLHKQFPGKKISDRRRPRSSTDLAEAKKPKSVEDEVVGSNSESDLETKKFKSILKESAKETDHYFNHSSYSQSRAELTHNVLPIVILKPLYASHAEMEEYREQLVGEDEASNKKRYAKLKMKEEWLQNTDEIRAEALISRKDLVLVGAEEIALTRINQKKEARNPKEENWKLKECVGTIKPKKMATHIPLNPNLQKKEAKDKKNLESQKEFATKKKVLSEAKIVPKFQKQVQRPRRKVQTNLNVVEELVHLPRDSNSSPDTASEWSLENKNEAVEEKVINEVTVDKSVVIKFGCQNEEEKPDQTNSPTSLLHMKEKFGSSNPQICECCSEHQTSPTHLCRSPGTDAGKQEEACKYMDHAITDTKTGTNQKASISRIQPSADRANELFHLNVNGNSCEWISADEPAPNICDAMDYGTDYRRMKEVINGVSGLGWITLESVNEAEDIVEDLEKRILVGLIQEVFG